MQGKYGIQNTIAPDGNDGNPNAGTLLDEPPEEHLVAVMGMNNERNVDYYETLDLSTLSVDDEAVTDKF